ASVGEGVEEAALSARVIRRRALRPRVRDSRVREEVPHPLVVLGDLVDSDTPLACALAVLHPPTIAVGASRLLGGMPCALRRGCFRGRGVTRSIHVTSTVT